MPAKLTTAQFIAKSIEIHGNCYNYELVDYKNNKSKIKIICREHGEFLQTPDHHYKGHGCPSCGGIAKSENAGWSRTAFADKCEKNNNGLGILYILECFNDNERFYKIGITSNSVKRRYDSSTKMPYLYSIVKEITGDPVEIYNLETKLHQINKQNQYIPSIPFAGHATECFKEYKENN